MASCMTPPGFLCVKWITDFFGQVANNEKTEMSLFKIQSTAERVNQLLTAGKPEDAIDLCRSACQGPKATPLDWELYGCLSADTGDLDAARSALVKAIQLDPGLVLAQFGLGKLLAMAGEYPEAIERLQKATQLQPDNAEIWLALGITCGLVKQMTKAEECCRRSLELQPRSPDAHLNLANALQAQGKLSEAEAEYVAALELIRDWLTAGTCWHRRGLGCASSPRPSMQRTGSWL